VPRCAFMIMATSCEICELVHIGWLPERAIDFIWFQDSGYTERDPVAGPLNETSWDRGQS
jgi:hypothetical protein